MAAVKVSENVLRVLRRLGVDGDLTLTRAEEDRVWAWPKNDNFLRHVVVREWYQDLKRVAENYHGSRISFREPGGVRPALQVVFHQSGEDTWPYFLEIDLDLSAPTGLLGKLRHGWEWVSNAVTKSKTNQQQIAELLDRRFGSD